MNLDCRPNGIDQYATQKMLAFFVAGNCCMQARDLFEVMHLQSEFLKNLYSTTADQFKQATGGFMTAAENTAKGNPM